jgi:hypothetical protein
MQSLHLFLLSQAYLAQRHHFLHAWRNVTIFSFVVGWQVYLFIGDNMTDYEAIVLSCPAFADFSRAFAAVCRALPPEMRERLSSILKNYFAAYGIEGACQRMSNRTVAQIFAEYQPVDVAPIASGEADGVRYDLYDAPPATRPDEKGGAGAE